MQGQFEVEGHNSANDSELMDRPHDDMVSVPSGIGNFEDQIVSARLPVATSRSRSVDCQPSEHHLLQLERVELERLEPATRPANKQLQIFRR